MAPRNRYVTRDTAEARVRNAIDAVNLKWRRGGAPIEHRIAAVLVAFLGCCNSSHCVTAEDVEDAWGDLAELEKVVRGDFILEPDGDDWYVCMLDNLPDNMDDFSGYTGTINRLLTGRG